jgi:AcrR family transcriptional regulator
VATSSQAPSARRDELLELAYAYVLEHGLSDLSLRPLAQAVGSSPRVLLFLFGSKDELVRALLARAREDELALLTAAMSEAPGEGLAAVGGRLWRWLSAPQHRGLLRLWTEGYGRSLVESDGAWRGFAERTVREWLVLLEGFQPSSPTGGEEALAQRTALLAVLRGAMLDLLATGDLDRTTAAVEHQLRAFTRP